MSKGSKLICNVNADKNVTVCQQLRRVTDMFYDTNNTLNREGTTVLGTEKNDCLKRDYNLKSKV